MIDKEEERKLWREGLISYQPSDPNLYHYTKEGVTVYNSKQYQLFNLNKATFFKPVYDEPIKPEKVKKDFTGRDILKGDFIYILNKKDRGFYKVINYRGKSVLFEDLKEGGRAQAKPENILVLTDQLKSNILKEQAKEANKEAFRGWLERRK